MPAGQTSFRISTRSKIIFLLSLFVFIYWTLGRVLNIYHYPAVGALFEFLWFPIVCMMFLLPFVAAYFMVKEGFSFRSLYLYSIIIIGLTFVVFNKHKQHIENSTAHNKDLPQHAVAPVP